MRREEEAIGIVPRSRRSREDKARLVERWCESGLSRAEFCRRQKICYGSFLGWIARWMEEEEAAQVPEFVEVLAAAPKVIRGDGESGGIELIAPNGWRVRLGGDFETRNLERIVEVLARC
jgi:transposase-like protein